MRNLKLKGLKYNKGKYSLYENRFVFFPPQIINILSSIYGEGVKSLLVWLGKKAGWSLIQKWDESLKSKALNDLVSNFCNIFSNHGWGKFIPKQISDNLIIIQVHHNVSKEIEGNSKNVCYFLTGFRVERWLLPHCFVCEVLLQNALSFYGVIEKHGLLIDQSNNTRKRLRFSTCLLCCFSVFCTKQP